MRRRSPSLYLIQLSLSPGLSPTLRGVSLRASLAPWGSPYPHRVCNACHQSPPLWTLGLVLPTEGKQGLSPSCALDAPLDIVLIKSLSLSLSLSDAPERELFLFVEWHRHAGERYQSMLSCLAAGRHRAMSQSCGIRPLSRGHRVTYKTKHDFLCVKQLYLLQTRKSVHGRFPQREGRGEARARA